MNDDIRAQVIAALLEVAPEVDASTIDDDADLLDEYDLDSMDLLNLVTTLHERFGVDIPEDDYAQVRTVRSAVDYLQARATVRPG